MAILAHEAAYGFFWLGPLIFFGFFLLFFLFVGRRWKRGGYGHWHRPGISILEEMYAKGDISRDEYMRRREDLLGT